MLARILGAAALVLLGACYSPAILHGPRTLPAGAWEVEVGIVAGVQPDDPAPRDPSVPRADICRLNWNGDCRDGTFTGGPADLRAGVRLGLNDWSELGIQVASFALQLDTVLQLVRTPGFDLAIDPTVFMGMLPGSRLFDGAEGIVALRAPLLAGLNFAPTHTLILYGGPSWIPTRHDDRVRAELGVGYELRTAPNLRIVPTFGVITPYEADGSIGFFGGLGFGVGAEGARDYAGTGW